MGNMDEKTLQIIGFDKVLERLASHTTFSGGREAALYLRPHPDLDEVRRRLAETEEARTLLASRTVEMGGIHDVRPLVEQAERGVMLRPSELLEVQSTLRQAGNLRRVLVRFGEQFPNLGELGYQIEDCRHVAEQIGGAIDDSGTVMDNASTKLLQIRQKMKEAQGRLMRALERIITSPAYVPHLQEALITQRNGRYVIPVRAESRGAVRGLVQGQSSSGATFFIEPMATVELNNQVREWQLAEEREIRRILGELSNAVAEEAVYIVRTVEILAELDLIFARAHYAEALNANNVAVLPFASPRPIGDEAEAERMPLQHPGVILDFKAARHPLLDPATVVPIDVHFGEDWFVLLITGPNTGGKTVTLKTVGLLTAMAQSGMHIPVATGGRFTPFESIYADIGDEQSIEQSLSTFSAHMNNIIRILQQANSNSLVLLDELGAGTDPEEGSALARALLNFLLQHSVPTIATTHYPELKVFGHNTAGVINASVEFDPETLAPTYELSIGLPGRSNALAIARQLGLSQSIIAAAKAMVRPESLEVDRLLAEIRTAREDARRQRQEAARRLQQLEAMEADLRYQTTEIEKVRREVINEAREVAQEELSSVRAEIAQIRSRLHSLGSVDRSLHEQMLAEAEKVLREREKEAAVVEEAALTAAALPAGPLQVGDKAWVPNLATNGEIVAIEGEEAEVQVGSFRLKVPYRRLQRAEAPVAAASEAEVAPAAVRSVGVELDVRGQHVEEMLPKLEKYLDDAYLAAMPWVRIIHGKGTGTLRQVVRDMVRRHPLVKAYRSGEAGEGGDGVTVVTFVGS